MKTTSNSPFIESNIKNTLSRIGFSSNEITLYTHLITHPDSKTGALTKATGIGSSAVYAALDHLKEEGLVSYQVKNNIKYYRAESPAQLIDQLQEHEAQLSLVAKLIADAQVQSGPRNFVNVYEGMYGFKRAFQQFIDAAPPKSEVTITGYNITHFIQDKPLRRFFAELDKGLQAKKATAKVLAEKNLLPTFKKDRRGIDIYEVRTLPARYFGPYAIDTTEHEVLLSIITGTPIVISIKHPVIVSAFRKNFDYLWRSAQKT